MQRCLVKQPRFAILITRITKNVLLTLHDAGHPVSLIVANEEAQPLGDLPVPDELPIYFVKKNWDHLETIQLD